MKKNRTSSLLNSLKELLAKTKDQHEIKISQIFESLAGKGYACLFVIFSFPFCLPLQIPGFSTPFGLALAFLGLREAFGHKLWWPKWILEKKVKRQSIVKLEHGIEKVLAKLQRLLYPRLLYFVKSDIVRKSNGLLVFFLALLLSLPLPVPMSNMLSALPIFFIGIGILEDDGLAILIAYFLALICFAAFIGLFFFGKALING